MDTSKDQGLYENVVLFRNPRLAKSTNDLERRVSLLQQEVLAQPGRTDLACETVEGLMRLGKYRTSLTYANLCLVYNPGNRELLYQRKRALDLLCGSEFSETDFCELYDTLVLLADSATVDESITALEPEPQWKLRGYVQMLKNLQDDYAN